LRFGRQTIDTPLADSDDIRMISNSFEAYVANYKIENFSLMAGYLNRWQGHDAGIDNGWVKMGKSGVSFIGLNYFSKAFDTSLWYYNILNQNNSLYMDFNRHFKLQDGIAFHFSGQYLKQNEFNDSGIEANIYGAMAQVDVSSVSFLLAYNFATKKKQSFSGFGGGVLYTKYGCNDIR